MFLWIMFNRSRIQFFFTGFYWKSSFYWKQGGVGWSQESCQFERWFTGKIRVNLETNSCKQIILIKAIIITNRSNYVFYHFWFVHMCLILGIAVIFKLNLFWTNVNLIYSRSIQILYCFINKKIKLLGRMLYTLILFSF